MNHGGATMEQPLASIHNQTLPPIPQHPPPQYSTIGSPEYEVIRIQPSTQKSEYHRLNHMTGGSVTSPLPPDAAPQRQTASTGDYSPWSSTYSDFPRSKATTLPVLNTTDDHVKLHVYNTLEGNRDAASARSSMGSSPSTPSVFEHADSRIPLIPSVELNHIPPSSRDHGWSRANESLYHRRGLSNPVFPFGGLQRVPETGTMFSEPEDPSYFPVSVYDEVPTATAPYELPIVTKTDSMASPLHSGILTMSTLPLVSEATQTSNDNLTGKSTPDYTLDTTSDCTENNGDTIEGFALRDSGTYSSDSSLGPDRDNPFYTSAYIPSSVAGLQMEEGRRSNTTECVFTTGLVATPSSRKSNTTDCAFVASPARQEESSDETADSTTHEAATLPLQRTSDQATPNAHAYRHLEIGSLEPKVKYTKLEIGRNTAV